MRLMIVLSRLFLAVITINLGFIVRQLTNKDNATNEPLSSLISDTSPLIKEGMLFTPDKRGLTPKRQALNSLEFLHGWAQNDLVNIHVSRLLNCEGDSSSD